MTRQSSRSLVKCPGQLPELTCDLLALCHSQRMHYGFKSIASRLDRFKGIASKPVGVAKANSKRLFIPKIAIARASATASLEVAIATTRC